MKKVLFATTALLATTSMAAAEVSFGGFGRFGLIYEEDADATPGQENTRIDQRFRLTATGTATSDNGLEFEGRIRWQTDDAANGTGGVAANSAAGFAVTSGGFRLDVGHVSNVFDSGDVLKKGGFGIGLTDFIDASTGFGNIPASGFGTGTAAVDPTVKLRYKAGDFTVSASIKAGSEIAAANNDLTTAGTRDVSFTSTDEWQLGVGYSFGDYNVGAIVGSTSADTITDNVTVAASGAVTINSSTTTAGTDNDFWVIGFDGTVGAFGFTILVGDSDKNDDTSVGLSASYDINDATEIRFAYSDSGAATGDSDSYGIGFRHSLGGGVSLRGGIGEKTGSTIADLGVVFNF